VSDVGGSLWLARDLGAPFAPLGEDVTCDVAIVGGGIVGTTSAMLLAAEGRDVTLVEARTLGSGTTGTSTAKATLLHAASWASLIDRIGLEPARSIVHGERAALDLMAKWSAELGVPDAARPVWHWNYASSEDGIEQLRAEVDAAEQLGVDVRWADPGECPFGTHALGVAEQLLIEPVVLAVAFARRAIEQGARVHERSRVVDLSLGAQCELPLEGGTRIRAASVVLATQLPITDRAMVWAGSEYRRSHVVALAHDDAFAAAPDMYTGIDPGALSVRPARDVDGTTLVLVAGQGHPLGEAEDGTHVEQLARDASELTGGGELRRAWLAHDVFPTDQHPFVGPIRGHDNVYVATGFGGWGLAAGASAALAISGLILRGHSAWDGAMSPRRLGPYVKPGALKAAAASVKSLVIDRLTADHEGELADLAPGHGVVVRLGGRTIAVARDDAGAFQAVSAACTHLGCTIAHDAERGCWQCPCHGSRFALDGEVLQGPATRRLEVIDVSELELPGADRLG
jgi:glycine/D-amino acid oxidase-like deaminating enzyme/nitrite reductase/ring-hydroxylating ferredoxin subunit